MVISLVYYIRKVASPYVQVALQPHESKKLNLVVPEKSCDFSYTITKEANFQYLLLQNLFKHVFFIIYQHYTDFAIFI